MLALGTRYRSATRRPVGGILTPGRSSPIAHCRPRHGQLAQRRDSRARALQDLPGAAAAPTSPPPAQPMATTWEVTVTSNAFLDEDDHAGCGLQLVVLDRDSGARSDPISLDSLPWQKQAKEGLDGLVKGWSRKGTVQLPPGLRNPGAVLVTKEQPEGAKGPALDYLSTLSLKSADGGEVSFLTHSWVSSEQGARAFFGGAVALPQDTPAALATLRKQELESLRGTEAGPKTRSARSYGYQVYDDLSKKDKVRPPLGGPELPYPRHLANFKDGQPGPGTPWVPFDEEFDFRKQQGFTGSSVLGVVQALSVGIADTLGLRPSFRNYSDVYGVFLKDGGATGARQSAPLLPAGKGAADDDDGSWGVKVDSDLLVRVEGKVEGGSVVQSSRVAAKASKDAAAAEDRNGAVAPAADADPGLLQIGSYVTSNLVKSLWAQLKRGDDPRIKFEVPRVMAGRREEWATDEEYGRQFLAGENPCTLFALKQLPSQLGSAIGPQHVDEELKALGAPSLEQLVAEAASGGKPRLYWADYWMMDAFWGEGEPQKNRAEHAGRCLLFLVQGSDGRDQALVPIAIELKARPAKGADQSAVTATSGWVYSRQELARDPQKQVLWQLAKAVFRSLDSGIHQLISHWLRSHACMEPFIIAFRRQISAMHPVYKLMLPHFRYTLQINAAGRGALINAGGIIESCFTPGPYVMRYSSAVYRGWRFADQALPTDLQNRAMVDGSGRPWLDYPFADDGLDIWNHYTKYFDDYLALYYASDAAVAADTELQAWWEEVKSQGHVDLKLCQPDEAAVWGFAGPIATRAQLCHVLVTIAWTCSGHHASVNFGQYDFSGLLLNTSPMVRKPIPDPSMPEAPEYQELVYGKGGEPVVLAVGEVLREAVFSAAWSLLRGRPLGWQPATVWQSLVKAATGRDRQERAFLKYICDPFSFLQQLVTLKLLSTHAEGEQTLDLPNVLLTDPEAVELNQKFIAAMKELDAQFEARNRDPARWTRKAGSVDAMEYTLLCPSSPPGLTFRGVPYSISI